MNVGPRCQRAGHDQVSGLPSRGTEGGGKDDSFPLLVLYPTGSPEKAESLGPPPERMTSPAFPPSQDPEGFDRGAVRADLNAEVLAFLRRVLWNTAPRSEFLDHSVHRYSDFLLW